MSPPRLEVGESIEVHVSFNDSWSDGYEIAAVHPTGYRLRRTDNRALFPDLTSEHDVRPVEARAPWPRAAPI